MPPAPPEPPASTLAHHQTMAFRRGFLVTVMVTCCLWSGAMILPACLGWAPLGPAQTANNTVFFLATCTLLMVLLRWPWSFRCVGIVFCTASFLYLAAAQFLVAQDQLRMLLFFPMVGAIFLIVGAVAAWIAIVAAIGVFAAAVVTGDLVASPLAVSTFVLTLGTTGLFFHAFSRQASLALATISAQNSALDAVAREDHLTHLLNLRAFRQIMHAALTRPDGAPSLCVAFIDIDHFKPINDHHGHAVGDAVLTAVARTLKASVRQQDAVARIGGEEFAVLMPDATLAVALPVAERLREAVQAMKVVIGGAELRVTVSVGLAASSLPHRTADNLLQEADAAMYRAKQGGRNRVVAASADLKRPLPVEG